jgi:propionyl-CoA carboxylase alpha chain
MNTRLQVEHPVTEEITGLDLVEQMIRVAAGEKLAFGQEDVRLDGWSVETRVYAEDPYRGFLPSIGRLTRYDPPHSSPLPLAGGVGGGPVSSASIGTSPLPTPPASGRGVKVRVDDGVVEGGEVSMFYDPMIAKLITWAPTRAEAIDAQIAALDAFEIEGPGTNLDFLSALMQHPRFRAGTITTGFIAEEYPDGFTGAPAGTDLIRLLAATAAFVATAQADRARRIGGQLGHRLSPPADWVVRITPSTFRSTASPSMAKGSTSPLNIPPATGWWRWRATARPLRSASSPSPPASCSPRAAPATASACCPRMSRPMRSI